MTATGRTPFWWEAIATARANGGDFTPEDVRRAASWVSCACGEQDPRIPRKKDGAPVDDVLERLGCDFNAWVVAGKPDKAAEVLVSIERRVAVLLASTPKLHRICSWCDGVLEEGDPGAKVSHGCCDSCVAVLRQQAAELAAERQA